MCSKCLLNTLISTTVHEHLYVSHALIMLEANGTGWKMHKDAQKTAYLYSEKEQPVAVSIKQS